MRPFLLLLAAAAAPALAQSPADSTALADDRATWAPTAQGVRLLGGYAAAGGFNNGFSASLEPRVGRFVRDGLAVSAQVGVSGSRSSFTSVDLVDGVPRESEQRTRSVGVSFGPAVTQYFGGAGAAVYPFVGAAVYGDWSRSWSGVVGQPLNSGAYWGLSGSARAGVMVPVARNVSIEAQVYGSVYDLDPRLDGNVGFSAGISTFLY